MDVEIILERQALAPVAEATNAAMQNVDKASTIQEATRIDLWDYSESIDDGNIGTRLISRTRGPNVAIKPF